MGLHHNGGNDYLFVNGTGIHKDSEIVAILLSLVNISEYFSVDNMKKTVLNKYVYDFSAGYDVVAVDNILDINEYLMKNNGVI